MIGFTTRISNRNDHDNGPSNMDLHNSATKSQLHSVIIPQTAAKAQYSGDQDVDYLSKYIS